MKKEKQNYKRFSVTMPAELYEELEEMAEDRGMDNRSMMISDLVKREVLKHRQMDRTRVMAGTLTITYDAAIDDCANRLIALRRNYLDEVISTFQVMLEDGKNLEIWLVQGQVEVLHTLLSQALKCSKSMMGQITFADAILPPLRTNR
ncbi:CopG family ribbon-helix-helix protein [Pontiella agarivorans]|uniref:CopG family ribbon-helix-helix protein n=1 Tax=Pontiella agarivorans TaxID=3038953 RepID=A0ABU5MXR4_9BACT|nr:CopG family ribbon-helix-helix protein [Pontiella agarivorans]MDZ8118952.1 CopG family ribbon-helix-helix protein [Pontiella agarivorans]